MNKRFEDIMTGRRVTRPKRV